jgi:hypothetical protein
MNNPKPRGGEKTKSIARSFYRATQFIASVFTGELFRDTVIGSAIGSIAAGNPITSYIRGAYERGCEPLCDNCIHSDMGNG